VACYCSERKVVGSFGVARCGRANAKCGVASVLQSRGVHSLNYRACLFGCLSVRIYY
jgi:hypothetical protein